jgi:photoactive yellow protein
MTVISFEQGEPENPLGRLGPSEVAQIPFGAAELDPQGKVVAYNDTEPDELGGSRQDIVGRDFFTDVARWAGSSMIQAEFKKGVEGKALNIVFDCAVGHLPYRVRIHFKVSPILGTYWVFIKRLVRAQG